MSISEIRETVFHISDGTDFLKFSTFVVTDTGISWGVYGHTPDTTNSTLIAEFAYSIQAADFAAIVDTLVKRTHAINDLINALNRIGFGDPDAQVNGGDTVEILNEHLPDLNKFRTIDLSPRLSQPHPNSPDVTTSNHHPESKSTGDIPY